MVYHFLIKSMKTLYGNTLLNEFSSLISAAKNRIWICSPYVGSFNFINKISDGKITNKEISIRFITDKNEISHINYEFFEQLIKIGELRTLAGIHAKIYIVDNKCIITSANLTQTAFFKRYEIGLLLDEQEAKESICVYNSYWNKSLKLDKLEAIKKLSKPSKNNNDEVSGRQKLPKIWSINKRNKSPQFWLKPIGVSEYPITENQRFSESQERLHFSVTPLSVEINDILIAYGIGAKRILTIYKVKTKGIKLRDEEQTEEWMKRWPHYVIGENLTPYFGEIWMKHNLYAKDLVNEYLENNPSELITLTSKGLGALKHKKDKFRLHPDFAGFIINKIEYCTNQQTDRLTKNQINKKEV